MNSSVNSLDCQLDSVNKDTMQDLLLKFSEVQKVIEVINKMSINELNLEIADIKLNIRKSCNCIPAADKQNIASLTSLVMPTQIDDGQVPKMDSDLHYVTSPIVGTFYRAPSSGATPFVQVGDFVKSGQTLCIIEAMKLMNEIECDVSGELVSIMVNDGQPVEYGERLFSVRVR